MRCRSSDFLFLDSFSQFFSWPSEFMCSVDGEGLQTGHLLDTACLPACVRETTCPRCADLFLFFSSVSAYFFADLPLPLLLLAAPQFINIVALSTHHMFYHPNKLPQWQLLSLVCLGCALSSNLWYCIRIDGHDRASQSFAGS